MSLHTSLSQLFMWRGKEKEEEKDEERGGRRGDESGRVQVDVTLLTLNERHFFRRLLNLPRLFPTSFFSYFPLLLVPPILSSLLSFPFPLLPRHQTSPIFRSLLTFSSVHVFSLTSLSFLCSSPFLSYLLSCFTSSSPLSPNVGVSAARDYPIRQLSLTH